MALNDWSQKRNFADLKVSILHNQHHFWTDCVFVRVLMGVGQKDKEEIKQNLHNPIA